MSPCCYNKAIYPADIVFAEADKCRNLCVRCHSVVTYSERKCGVTSLSGRVGLGLIKASANADILSENILRQSTLRKEWDKERPVI